jgi:spermidine/putrescine ABC transporter ATP-binding subunit
MPALELRDVTKSFGRAQAVRGVSLAVDKGELISLLGPSGCGKTTILRMISGFLKPDAGTILLGGQVVNHVSPHKRETGMVYQNYALFPHMTVFDNIAFGLRMRRLPRQEITARVERVLELTRLASMADRFPSQLSGGQQQRVALARAVVIKPVLLLLDEPLSNLDAKLRSNVRQEIRALQQSLSITTLFVTHDQEEALSISDRVAIMNRGCLEQVGSPVDVYCRPRSTFVADFVGSANILAGHVHGSRADGAELHLRDGCRVFLGASPEVTEGHPLAIAIRPERLQLHARQPAGIDNVFPVVLEQREYIGATTRYRVRLPNGEPLVVQLPAETPLPTDSGLFVSWGRDASINLPPTRESSDTSEDSERPAAALVAYAPGAGNSHGGA